MLQLGKRLREMVNSWHHCEDDDGPLIRTVYRDPKGTITSDGRVYQAWRQLSRTHVQRVDNVLYTCLADAKHALEKAE
jgi:hypothetical protein